MAEELPLDPVVTYTEASGLREAASVYYTLAVERVRDVSVIDMLSSSTTNRKQ